MKLNKSAFAAIVVAFTFGTFNAKALPFPPFHQFETLNFNLTAAKQGFVTVTNGIVMPTIETSRIKNKDLMVFLAAAFNTNWPNGSQLALDRQGGDIFVVDKSGTNPIFDVSIGINIGNTNVAFFSDSSDPSVFAGVKHGATQGQIRYGKFFFHLFNQENGITNTDLNFDGLDTTEGHLTNDGVIIQSDTVAVSGDGTYIDGTWTVVEGEITGSGKWDINSSQPTPLSAY